MKKVTALAALGAVLVMSGTAAAEWKMDGKAEFVEHCAPCHKDGGNTVNPKKTLS